MVQGASNIDTESVFLAKQGEWLQLATIMEPGCWVSLETMYLLQLQSIFKFLSLLFSPLVCSMFSAVLSWQKYEEWGNGCKVRGFDGSTAREGLGSEPDVHAAHLAFGKPNPCEGAEEFRNVSKSANTTKSIQISGFPSSVTTWPHGNLFVRV